MTTYYKVVYRGRDNSLISSNAPPALTTQYVPGEWAKPPAWAAANGYGLLVFDSLAAARDFNETAAYEIWECKVFVPHRTLPLFGPCYAECGVPRWMKKKYTDLWPRGTVMVSKVKLIRRVDDGI